MSVQSRPCPVDPSCAPRKARTILADCPPALHKSRRAGRACMGGGAKRGRGGGDPKRSPSERAFAQVGGADPLPAPGGGSAHDRMRRGAALLALGRFEESLAECDEAVRLDPRGCKAHGVRVEGMEIDGEAAVLAVSGHDKPSAQAACLRPSTAAGSRWARDRPCALSSCVLCPAP